MPCRSVQQCVVPCAGPLAAPTLPFSNAKTCVYGAVVLFTTIPVRCANRVATPAASTIDVLVDPEPTWTISVAAGGPTPTSSTNMPVVNEAPPDVTGIAVTPAAMPALVVAVGEAVVPVTV